MVKILITIVITVVATVALVVGLGAMLGSRTSNKAEPAVTVRMESPARGDLVEIVSAPGHVEPMTRISISARVPARITELPYEQGDRVTKGDPAASPAILPSVLVKLDASDLAAVLRSVQARRSAQAAEIQVAKASIDGQDAVIEGLAASLAEAQANLGRRENLYQSGDVSKSDYDQAKCRFDELSAQLRSAGHTAKSRRLNLQVLEHHLTAADAEIAQATEQLSYTTITSPIDGTVTAVNASVGELVVTGTMNNPGTVDSHASVRR